MLAWLHSTFDIIAHRKGKQMDSQELLARLDLESVHTPTLLTQMHLETPRASGVYLPCHPHHLFCKSYKHNSDFKKEE